MEQATGEKFSKLQNLIYQYVAVPVGNFSSIGHDNFFTTYVQSVRQELPLQKFKNRIFNKWKQSKAVGQKQL